jgi:hypothetical protein
MSVSSLFDNFLDVGDVSPCLAALLRAVCTGSASFRAGDLLVISL